MRWVGTAKLWFDTQMAVSPVDPSGHSATGGGPGGVVVGGAVVGGVLVVVLAGGAVALGEEGPGVGDEVGGTEVGADDVVGLPGQSGAHDALVVVEGGSVVSAADAAASGSAVPPDPSPPSDARSLVGAGPSPVAATSGTATTRAAATASEPTSA